MGLHVHIKMSIQIYILPTLIKWKYILHVNISSFVKPCEARTNVSLTSDCPTVFTIYYFYIISGCFEEGIFHEHERCECGQLQHAKEIYFKSKGCLWILVSNHNQEKESSTFTLCNTVTAADSCTTHMKIVLPKPTTHDFPCNQ